MDRVMNTLQMVTTIASFETTKAIAVEFERILSEIGNITTDETQSAQEIVACVVLAQLRAGKATLVTVS